MILGVVVLNMPRKAKHISDVSAFARTHTDTAIKTLVGIAASPSCNESSRVAAAIALLNRGWGNPNTTVNLNQAIDKTEVKIQLLELFGQIESTARDITPTNESSKVIQ